MITTPTFTASIDTKMLAELLRSTEIRGIVTYVEMQTRIGRDPQKQARGSLQSARKMLEKEGLVFAAVKNVGMMRLDDIGVIRNAEADVCSIRRKARRSFNRVSQGVHDYVGLNAQEKMRFNATASILGMITTVLDPRRVRKLEDRVKGESGALPLAKTLEAFRD